jgi:hypothetical protein
MTAEAGIVLKHSGGRKIEEWQMEALILKECWNVDGNNNKLYKRRIGPIQATLIKISKYH